MAAGSAQPAGPEWFTDPTSVNHRRYEALRAGYATVTPETIQRCFLETPGQIITHGDAITVRLDRRAYSPVLRKADIPATRIPWLGDRNIRYELA
jgi:hypothetical protein